MVKNMEHKRIIKHLKEDFNCYVEELPNLTKLEKELGFEIEARATLIGGYELRKKGKKVENNVKNNDKS